MHFLILKKYIWLGTIGLKTNFGNFNRRHLDPLYVWKSTYQPYISGSRRIIAATWNNFISIYSSCNFTKYPGKTPYLFCFKEYLVTIYSGTRGTLAITWNDRISKYLNIPFFFFLKCYLLRRQLSLWYTMLSIILFMHVFSQWLQSMFFAKLTASPNSTMQPLKIITNFY